MAAATLIVFSFVALGQANKRSAPAAEERVRWVWIALLVTIQGGTQVWSNLPGRIDLARSLPLHICDLVPWIGILGLVGSARWARALAYFWGIGLSIWAFVLPILDVSSWSLEYWLFWIGHAQIIGTAIYLIGVSGYRPNGTDLRLAVLATAGYAAIIAPIDIWLAADYGYLGQRSAAAELGPWPTRIAILLFAEASIFVALMIPWWIAGRFNGERQSS